MNWPLRSLLALTVAAGMALTACAQPSAPAPTQVPTAAPKVAEPTKAPAAAPAPTQAPAPQPTAVPAKKVSFPEKGKSISIIVPYAAGGSNDVVARLLAPMMEQELGVPVQVVNKPGGSGQIGWTELATSKPDGYTLAMTSLPSIAAIYLDAERKAVFTRKDFAVVAGTMLDPNAFSVKSDSPHKTLKDLIDAAKASPEKVKVGVGTMLGSLHLATLLLEKTAGVTFAKVFFDGGAPTRTALLGGHVDAAVNNSSEIQAQFKSQDLRVLGIAGKQDSRFLPEVKTLEAQGYKIVMGNNNGLLAPAGVPQEIVEILSAAAKKALTSDDMKKKMEGMALEPWYRSPAEYTAMWQEDEASVGPIMDLARQK